MKFLTFGEIMLRLKAPGQECFFQSPMLEAKMCIRDRSMMQLPAMLTPMSVGDW